MGTKIVLRTAPKRKMNVFTNRTEARS